MAHLSCPLTHRAQTRSHGDSTSLPGLGPADVTSCFPVSASFSPLAPGSQSPLLGPLPEGAAASYEPLSCLGPRSALGAQWGPWPHPALAPGTQHSGLHAGPPVHLSLKQQEHMNEAPRRPGDRNTAQSSARAVTLSPLVWTSWGKEGERKSSGSKESTARGMDPGSTLSRNNGSKPTRHTGQGQKRAREQLPRPRLPRPQLQTGGPAA